MYRKAREAILEKKLIVICRRLYGDDLRGIARALSDGGLGLIEVTFDQADSGCVEKTCEAIRMLVSEFGERVMPGAGTVLTTEQVMMAKESGARYIISPNVNAGVIALTKELGLVSIPGAMTPTEIISAHNAGADFVKLFPSGYLGFSYIKDIMGPISHVRLIATGGVTEESLPEYLRLGFAGAGVSGRLTDKALIASGNFGEIENRARAFAAIAAGNGQTV